MLGPQVQDVVEMVKGFRKERFQQRSVEDVVELLVSEIVPRKKKQRAGGRNRLGGADLYATTHSRARR